MTPARIDKPRPGDPAINSDPAREAQIAERMIANGVGTMLEGLRRFVKVEGWKYRNDDEGNEYMNFEDWARDRLNMSTSTAYRMLQKAKVLDVVAMHLSLTPAQIAATIDKNVTAREASRLANTPQDVLDTLTEAGVINRALPPDEQAQAALDAMREERPRKPPITAARIIASLSLYSREDLVNLQAAIGLALL